MKEWDQKELQSSYPAMTEEFSARMNALIEALPARKEEGKMRKKISLSLALALILVLTMTATAVAASLGVFGQLANAHDPDGRMSDLDTVASPVGQTVTAGDGVTVTIDQAYYDGERVFVSYRMEGNLSRTEEGNGEIEDADWMNEEYGVAVDPDSPEAPIMEKLLNGEEGDWAKVSWVNMHDGLSLQDGTYLEIIGGEERLLEDGTVIGWKECEVPEEAAADTLECKAVLFRGTTIYQKHDGRLRAAFGRMDKSTDTDVAFTVPKQTDVTRLAGEKLTEAYAARAECTLNGVDIKSVITVQGQEGWVRAWMDWDYERSFDLIESWVLYSGDTRIGAEGNDRGVWGEGDTLYFEEIIRHGGHTENLRLVPCYADSGEHLDEAIELQIQP